ncbi:MAG TPA: ATP-binding protein [Pseudomonadota bacterium]|nr:ATP-binding protein [Pseudomonadota bacterium]
MMEPESSQSTGSQLPNPEDAEQSTVSAADTDAALGEGEALEVSSLSAQSPVVALSEEEPPLDPKMLLSPEPSTSMRTRLRFMVADEALTVRVDPEALPEQPIDASLWDIVPKVARRSLDLGLSMPESGFHIFVAADSEVMVEDVVVSHAERFAAQMDTPGDLVYIHDFEHPEAPKPLLLPPGTGPALVEAMGDLIEGLRERMPHLVDADDLERSHRKLSSEMEARNKQILSDLENTARTHGFGIRTVQGAVQTFPILHGKPLSAEQFDVLDETTKRALQGAADRLTREVEKAARLVRAQGARFDAEQTAAMARVAAQLIQREMRELFEHFASLSTEVARYLRRVRQALIDDWEDFLEPESDETEAEAEENLDDGDPELATRLKRFQINLLATHRPGEPAPVIYETNPTYANLYGHLERRVRFGALLTDFMRIRPGSMHRSMGGVLVVRAQDLLTDPLIWERLKRVLREKRLAVEDPVGPLGLYSTTLRPAPVPMAVRVVMVGSAALYDALRASDPDFGSLFRIKVEVDEVVPRSAETLPVLDAVLMSFAQKRGLPPFDRSARARLLDLSTRLAEDRERLSLCMEPLDETATFAVAQARCRAIEQPKSEGKTQLVVTADDVDAAWQERRERLASEERHIRELTLRGEVALDTTGMRVGVVNGLSVFHTGDVEFGQPMRITAVVALGREGIVDVEREAQLGGAIHTKGVAILRGYLARMFGQERPLSLRAQLVFEQSYGEIDGDSASSSELFAVLSALADVGIDQSISVTGSVNQLGEMQAIGGVCAKIEGFFDLCHARGLTGSQGVMIPKANLPHLVLRDDVVLAIQQGQFHVYAISSVAEGIEVLTGLPAGERDTSGRFPAASVFGRVERRIIEIAERLRQAEAHGYDGGMDGIEDGAAEISEGGEFRRLARPISAPAASVRRLLPSR